MECQIKNMDASAVDFPGIYAFLDEKYFQGIKDRETYINLIQAKWKFCRLMASTALAVWCMERGLKFETPEPGVSIETESEWS